MAQERHSKEICIAETFNAILIDHKREQAVSANFLLGIGEKGVPSEEGGIFFDMFFSPRSLDLCQCIFLGYPLILE